MHDLTAVLESIQVGQARAFVSPAAEDGRPARWHSAIDKQAVAGPVAVGQCGLAGDVQVDRANHGGIENAVLAYAAAHYDCWRVELPQHDWRHGGFGENLTLSGLDETTVCIGDRCRIGDVLLEVSQPRRPCWKLCRLWQQPDLAKRVVNTGRCGWYLRVLESGTIEAGQHVKLVERPLPSWTLDRANRLLYGAIDDQEAVAALARCPQLTLSWREDLISRRMR